MRGWADVGLWVAVCFLAKIFLHRPTCKTTFSRLHSHRRSRSHFAFSLLSDQWEIRLFFIFRNSFFVQNYRFLYHGDQIISWWRICMWRAVNFEIHLCSSDMKSDCIWRSISIQYVQIEPAWTLTSEMVPFGSKSVTLSMWIDLLTCTCRSTQVKIYADLHWFNRINRPLT